MSEGQVFFSVIPNITMHLPGVNPVEFKNGRFPKRKDSVCTDPQVIAALKGCPEYMKTIISEEDRIIRDAPDPKVTEDLLTKALERLTEIPGITPSELMPYQSLKEVLEESPEQPSEPLVLDTSLMDRSNVPTVFVPTLTQITRMNKDVLIETAEALDIDVHEGDTVAILKRKVKGYVRQLP